MGFRKPPRLIKPSIKNIMQIINEFEYLELKSSETPHTCITMSEELMLKRVFLLILVLLL